MLTARVPAALRIDPLIADARQRARRRRLLLIAALLAAALGTTLALRSSGDPGASRSLPPAALSAFLGHWWGHTRGIDVYGSGRGKEYINGGARPVLTLAFNVLGISGRQRTVVARIRVTAVRILDRSAVGTLPYIGEIGTLRLRRGIVTDSITRGFYCASSVDQCGL